MGIYFNLSYETRGKWNRQKELRIIGYNKLKKQKAHEKKEKEEMKEQNNSQQ